MMRMFPVCSQLFPVCSQVNCFCLYLFLVFLHVMIVCTCARVVLHRNSLELLEHLWNTRNSRNTLIPLRPSMCWPDRDLECLE